MSLWIDGSVEVHSTALIEAATEALRGSDWAMYRHPERSSIQEEADFCLTMLKYIGKPLREQVEHYAKNERPARGLWACTIIARRHTPKVLAAGAAWFEECLRWSDQDQLSLPVILAKHEIGIAEITAGGKITPNNPLFTVRGHRDGFMGALGISVLSRYDLLDRLIASAEDGIVKPHQYLIVDGGGQLDTGFPPIARAIKRGAMVSIYPGQNLGVAASWNVILSKAPPGHSVVIVSDEVVLGPKTLQWLYSKDVIDRHDFVTGKDGANGWCLSMQTLGCTIRVGPYDESFRSVRYVEADYRRRLDLTKTTRFELPTDHVRANYAEREDEYDLNRYVRKWGGASRDGAVQ